MILLTKTLAVLATIALARGLLGRRGGRVTAVVLAVLATGAFSTTLLRVVRDGVTLAKTNHTMTEYESLVVGAQWTDTPFDPGFVEWTRARAAGAPIYEVASPPPPSNYNLGWLSYRMLPSRTPLPGERSDVLVLWGPKAVESYDRRKFGPPELFAPGLGIARRRR